jgi:hypothetical protein
MSDDEILAAEAEERQRLIEQYRKTKATCFLDAALHLRRQGEKLDAADAYRINHCPRAATSHRPQLDDTMLLCGVAALLSMFPDVPLHTAARQIAGDLGQGHSVDATTKRLVRKWRALPQQTGGAALDLWHADKLRAAGYPAEADRVAARYGHSRQVSPARQKAAP